MNDPIGYLKSVGVEMIVERTRISQQNVIHLLERDFTKIRKVQFFGFVSILEREFDVDLSAYKEEFLSAMGSEKELEYEIPAYVSAPEKTADSRILWFVFAMAAVLVAGYFIFNTESDHAPAVSAEPVESIVIQEAQERLSAAAQQKEAQRQQALAEANATAEAEAAEANAALVPPKITILPKRRVWLGMINLETGKKLQTITESAYELNTSQPWLIVFGHGYIDIETDGKLEEYSDRQKLWFLFENDHLEKIDRDTFRMRNGGNAW